MATRIVAGVRSLAKDADHAGTSAARDILRYMLPLLLNAIYFSLQAPLTVWLAAYFANTAAIAQIGALGRLGAILALASGFAGSVFLPRLAMVSDDRVYAARYLAFWVFLIAIGGAAIALATLRPEWLLFLLGAEYAQLRDAVWIVTATAVLSTFGAYAVGVNHARGWIRPQPVALVGYAAMQVILVMRLDLSDAMGVLRFGLWSSAIGTGLQLAINAWGFARRP
jgi:hypothetical protein